MSHSAFPDHAEASALRGWHLTAVAAVGAVLLQLWGLYRVVGPAQPAWFLFPDKLQHTIGFAVPVLLILLTIALRGSFGWHWPAPHTTVLVVAIFAVHGVVSEVIQHLWYHHRTGDLFDVLADWVGVALGVLLFRLIFVRRRSRAVESLAT
jgi:VanZ family protein